MTSRAYPVLKSLFLSVLLMIVLFSVTACDEDDSKGVEPDPIPGILVNELMARNSTVLPDNESDFDDWIELYNADSEPYDIGGFTVTDDLDDPVQYTITIDNPDATTIEPGGYLILWADNEPEQGPLHLGFSLDGGGEEFGLYDKDGELIDAIVFGPQNEDISYGRLPIASDRWVFLEPSPGAANQIEADNMPPQITDTQRSPAVPLEDETVQVYTTVVDESHLNAVTLHYRADGGEFTALEMTPSDNTRFQASIPGVTAETTVEYYIEASDDENAIATDPRFAPSSNYSYTARAVPDQGPLYINEILAQNSSVNQDEDGDYDDWIELYNAGDEDIDVGGMYITDDLEEPLWYRIPQGQPLFTIIPAGGYLLLWADKELQEGPLHVNIKLSADGESVGLFASDQQGNELLDAFNFPAQEEDVSYGRESDGGSTIRSLMTPTPGATNNP